jgi:tripartite-type tricarboxylate transporter receptor subunit TctC
MNSFVRSLGLAIACLLLAAGGATAADYPTRNVRWIVGFAPGGPNDIFARLIGQRLTERLGQTFIIENRPGAGGNIGAEAVINAAPDGYTLLLINPSNAINATLYARLPFDFVRDVAPVAGIARVPNVMEVHPSLPVKTVAEFIAYAKANPGKINMASSGVGTSTHLTGELFKFITGVDIVHVPYRGSAPALTDLLGGQTQVMFDVIASSIGHVHSGALRGLAVTTAARSPVLPDLPTIGETVPGFEGSAWFGIGAPRGTPADIIDKLNKEVNAALADPLIQRRIAELGGVPIIATPAEFGTLIKDETEKWAKVVKFSGAKVD